MRDLSSSEEVGVLGFLELEESMPASLSPLPKEFWSISNVSKLTVEEPEVGLVESGIVLGIESGHEITIVAGGFPCSLAVSGIPTLNEIFDSEYPIDRYTRSPL
jgi:hypothetical protein